MRRPPGGVVPEPWRGVSGGPWRGAAEGHRCPGAPARACQPCARLWLLTWPIFAGSARLAGVPRLGIGKLVPPPQHCGSTTTAAQPAVSSPQQRQHRPSIAIIAPALPQYALPKPHLNAHLPSQGRWARASRTLCRWTAGFAMEAWPRSRQCWQRAANPANQMGPLSPLPAPHWILPSVVDFDAALSRTTRVYWVRSCVRVIKPRLATSRGITAQAPTDASMCSNERAMERVAVLRVTCQCVLQLAAGRAKGGAGQGTDG